MTSDSVTIQIQGREFIIPFPNVGQFYRIESLKQQLSRGFYNSMVMSPSAAAQQALDMIDVEATLVVLCPKLIEELKIKNFADLDIRDYTEIRNAFFKNVAPFFKEIGEILKGTDESKQK